MKEDEEMNIGSGSSVVVEKEVVVRSGKRCDYILSSATTEVQEDTEDECAPFFVNFTQDLSPLEIQHLRNIGLLPSLLPVEEEEEWSSPKLEQLLGTTTTSTVEEEDTALLDVCLLKEKHVVYLTRALHTFGGNGKKKLSSSYVSLDASRPWMMYWTLHSLDLLNAIPSMDPQIFHGILSTLSHCWQETSIPLPSSSSIPSSIQPNLTPVSSSSSNNDGMYVGGGFSGGPNQMAHCATTYAAILTLCIIAGCCDDEDSRHKEAAMKAQEMLKEKRWKIYVWFLQLKDPINGAYHMHVDGEMDVRAAYIVTCISTLLHIQEYQTLLDDSVTLYILKCQTYEGGFGGEPHVEAHGGYTYCALAALQLLPQQQQQQQQQSFFDVSALHGWLIRRQMSFEGGFSGRTNKLVDGCYSFWQGASLALLDTTTTKGHGSDWIWNTSATSCEFSWNEGMLQRYILLCAQDIHGGLRDKPSKPRDFYHSCYNLSGLSASQYSSLSFGHPTYSKVAPTHLLFNICISRVAIIHQLFHTTN